MDKAWVCAGAVALAGCSSGFTTSGASFGGDSGDTVEGGAELEGASAADGGTALDAAAAADAGDVADVLQVDVDAGELEAAPFEAGPVPDAAILCCRKIAGATPMACVTVTDAGTARPAYECGPTGNACPYACTLGATCWVCRDGWGGPGQPACDLDPAGIGGTVAPCE